VTAIRARAALCALLLTLGCVTALALPHPAHAATTDQGLGPDFDPTGNVYSNQPNLLPDKVKAGFGLSWQFPKYGYPGLARTWARPVMSQGHLIIATEANEIYGINPKTDGQQWHTVLTLDGKPLRADSANRSWAFPTTRPITPGTGPCTDLYPTVGVTGTPTVGPDGTVFMLAKVGEKDDPDGTRHARFELHALDPVYGKEKPGYPIRLGGNADNAPGVAFNAALENNRAALLLMNGVIYAAFGSHCDYGRYRGWIIGTRVSPGPPAITARWTTETGPDHPGDTDDDSSGQASPEAGIWQGGAPLVPDGAGGFFASSGNGDIPAAPVSGHTPIGTFGDAVMHFAVGSTGTLSVADFYIPSWANSLNKYDTDLGSGGPTLLPDDFGTPAYPHLAVIAGKSSDIWLLNRDNLGGYRQAAGGADAALSRLNVKPGVSFGKIAFFDGPGADKYVYVRVGEFLKAYRVVTATNGKPQLQEAGSDAGGGVALSGSPLITETAGTPGSGILWTEWMSNNAGTNAVLQAYAAIPGSDGKLTLLWSGAMGTAAKFQAPLVVDGWVYTIGRDGVLRAFHNPQRVPLASAGGDAGTVVQGTTSTGKAVTLTAQDQPVTITSLSIAGGATSPFALGTLPALPVTLQPGTSLSVPFSFTAPATIEPDPGQVVGSGTGFSDQILVGTNIAPVQVPLSGVDEYADGHLQVNAIVEMGDYPIGESPAAQPLTQTLSLANIGATNLVVTANHQPAKPPFGYTAWVNPTTIPPGRTVAIPLTFTTTKLADYDDTFDFAWNDGTTPTVTQVHVVASGVAPANVVFAPPPAAGSEADVVSTVDFGQVPVGTSVSKSFTVTNTGGVAATFSISKAPATVDGVSYDATAAIPEGATLAPGQQVTETITWTPPVAGPMPDVDWTFDVGSGAGKVVVEFVGTAVS
jgi:hypothetical protein